MVGFFHHRWFGVVLSYIVTSHMRIAASFDLMIFAGQDNLLGAGECDGSAVTNQGGVDLILAANLHSLYF